MRKMLFGLLVILVIALATGTAFAGREGPIVPTISATAFGYGK